MTSRLDIMWDWTRVNDSVGYYSGGGDNDHDGTADRADIGDGNGVDCSGWVWEEYRHAWAPYPAPFPLSSTAGYALMALRYGWIVPMNQAQPGDILIYDKYGDAYSSNGARGHTGIFYRDLGGGMVETTESAGSGQGVGFYPRPHSFWIMAIRIPGLHDKDSALPPPITPEQMAAYFRKLEELDMEHGQAVDFTVNPANPQMGYTLDRWGGTTPFGGAPKVKDGPYWPGQDVARRIQILNWSTGAGYIMDLDGALHAFNGAPKITGNGFWKNGKILAFNEA